MGQISNSSPELAPQSCDFRLWGLSGILEGRTHLSTAALSSHCVPAAAFSTLLSINSRPWTLHLPESHQRVGITPPVHSIVLAWSHFMLFHCYFSGI